jgi:hypothetical protein
MPRTIIQIHAYRRLRTVPNWSAMFFWLNFSAGQKKNIFIAGKYPASVNAVKEAAIGGSEP